MDNLHEQHSVPLSVYHIIWCLKRRRRIVRGDMAQRLEQLVNEGAVEHNWQVLNLSIQPDHVPWGTGKHPLRAAGGKRFWTDCLSSPLQTEDEQAGWLKEEPPVF